MITVTEAFLNAIKNDNRKCRGKVVLKYSTPITLGNEQLQSIEESSNAEISLGTVQNDDLTIKVMPNVLTEAQFNQEIDVEVWLGCDVANVPTYVKIGTYRTNGWDKSKTGIITIRLTNKIEPTAIIPYNIIAESGTFLEDYCEELVLNVFAENLNVASGITSQVLQKSWLMYDDITMQLKKMAEACNGLFRYTSGFELVPFKARTPVASLSMGPNEELIEVTRLSDYSKTKEQVSILKKEFNVTTMDKLTSSNLIIKGASQVLELKTGGPSQVTYVTFGSGLGQLSDITQGITWCNVRIAPIYNEGTYSEQVEVWGSKVQSITKDSKVVTGGSVTYIENPYIQTPEHVAALDKRIYEGIRYRLKYRGNPLYQVADTVVVSDVGELLIYKRQLSFNGGLSGVLEGVLLSNNGRAQILYEFDSVDYVSGKLYDRQGSGAYIDNIAGKDSYGIISSEVLPTSVKGVSFATGTQYTVIISFKILEDFVGYYSLSNIMSLEEEDGTVAVGFMVDNIPSSEQEQAARLSFSTTSYYLNSGIGISETVNVGEEVKLAITNKGEIYFLAYDGSIPHLTFSIKEDLLSKVTSFKLGTGKWGIEQQDLTSEKKEYSHISISSIKIYDRNIGVDRIKNYW